MSGNLLSRAFARLLLAAPVRKRLSGTMVQGFLASLAEETGRIDEAAELSPAEPMPPPALEVAGLFNEALRQVEQGRTREAAGRTIEKALKRAPDDVACLALAVMIFTLLGKRTVAEGFGRRAVELAPRVAALHINLGNCLRDQQKYGEALVSYQTALRLDPAIIQTWFNRAQCLAQLNRMEEAYAAYHKVVEMPADTVPAEMCRAGALVALDRLGEAETTLDHLLTQAPSHGQALIELATVYRRTRRHGRAEEILQSLLKTDPNNWMIHSQLAGLYCDTHRYDEGEEHGRRALAINPTEPTVMTALASVLAANGDLSEAESLARKATELRRGRAGGVLAMILERQCRFAEAGELFEQEVAAEPDKGASHFFLGLHLLRQGDYPRGWAECEWRWQWEQNPEVYRNLGTPQWTPAMRKGCSILVWAEQGLGDAIQMLRFIPILSAMGYKPILEVHKPLLSLARQALSTPVVENGTGLPLADSQIPILSLPHALGITPDRIPASTSYLAPDPVLASTWRDRLRSDGKRPMVGVAWSGNPQHGNDAHRSIPLASLERIFTVQGVRFISLQKQVRTGDEPLLAQLGDRIETGWINECADFADTAALIEQLDLVIAVDSAVIHLTGALGKPGWLLLPFSPDWRWMTDRADSLWYRSLRLFRQPAHRDWQTPIAQLAEELVGLTQPGGVRADA